MQLPIQSQPVLRNVSAAKIGTQMTGVTASSHWTCFYGDFKMPRVAGEVDIWWGHNEGAAKWACDNWISTCGNSPGGCWAGWPSN